MYDQSLYAHATTAAGVTLTGSTALNGPTLDLSSNSRVQNLEATLRVRGPVTGTTLTLDVKFQDSVDGTTWVNMPGATGATLGFPRRTDLTGPNGATGNGSDYASTDSIAASAPDRITLRTTKRYLRAVFTPSGATGVWPNVTLTLDPMGPGSAFGAAYKDN